MENLSLILFLVVAFAVFAYVEIKRPDAPIVRATSRAIAAVACIATIMQVLGLDVTGRLLEPDSHDDTIAVIPAIIPGQHPTSPPEASNGQYRSPATVAPIAPHSERSLIYHNSLSSAVSAPEWGVADDDDGASGFDGQGYFVRSKRGGRSHLVWNTSMEFDDLVLEVDATPLSAGELATLLVAVGWRDGDRGYLFIAAPNGECGLAVRDEDRIEMLQKNTTCPTLRVNRSSRIRVVVADGRLQAHIDGQPTLDHPLENYTGGFVGLGVLSYARDDSQTEASVRFRDLAIWSGP